MRQTGAYSRCTGLLCWYDEPLELLAAHISSQAGVIDHLVAVDGAWAAYPDAQPSSDPQQARLIKEICDGLRIGLTLHTPRSVWAGNEVEKRNFSLALAEAVTREDGWYYSGDADEVVTHVASDWFQQLEALAREDVGTIQVGIRETRSIPGVLDVVPNDTWGPITNVYRAYRGLTYGPRHYILHAPDPVLGMPLCVRGDRDYLENVGTFDGTDLLRFDHRQERPEWRNVAKREYYVRRDRFGFENKRYDPLS